MEIHKQSKNQESYDELLFWEAIWEIAAGT